MLKLLVRSLGHRTGVLGRGEVCIWLVSLGVSGAREGEVWKTEGREGLVPSLAVSAAADREGQAGVVVTPIHGHASQPC